MLTDYERNQAIKEGHKNNACAGYFQARTGLPPSKEDGRLFDSGFDRGWDAATAPLLAEIEVLKTRVKLTADRWQVECDNKEQQIAELKTEVERFRTDAMNEKLARQELDRLLAQTSGMNELQRMRIAELEAKLAQRVPDGYAGSCFVSGSEDPVVTVEFDTEAQAEKFFLMLSAAPAATEQQDHSKRCQYCDDTGDVHSTDGEWRGTCHCPAGQAPNAQQAEAQEPVEYQFQGRDGKWCWFMDERHRLNTIVDGTWPIRSLFTRPQPAQLQTLSEEELSKIFYGSGLNLK